MTTVLAEKPEIFAEELRALLGAEQVKVKEPMKLHTTFRIGGPASVYGMPKDEEAFCAAVRLCRERDLPCYILGRGSNLLVSDSGFDGVILSTEQMDRITAEGEFLTAGAGVSLARLARTAQEASLTGLEFASGIPGSLGGAVVMNAGAYGSEMKDVLTEVTVLKRDGSRSVMKAEDLELGYRHSCIPERGYVVLGASLRLSRGAREQIQARMEELAYQRKSKQPLEYPSAGSTFKRPPGYFAGKLIDDAGLRGFSVGGAQVSEKHCGFVINRGNATASDVLALCGQVKERVKEQFGVELELEVKYLG